MVKKQIKTNQTPLQAHRQNKKELNPPLLANGLNITPSSWLNERLPEMLWAALVIGNLERAEALKFFRYIANFVERNQECWDITLTNIAQLPTEKRKLFLRHFASYSEDTKYILRSLLLLPELPAIDDWREALPFPPIDDDWQTLMKGVAVTLWHQSQEATDCRWIKIFCQIVGGKLKFIRSSKGMIESFRGILEYPHYGDLRHISSFIRAGETAPNPLKENKSSDWTIFFWKYCFENTSCYPEEDVTNKIQTRQNKLVVEIEDIEGHYIEEVISVRNKLIDHFFASAQTSAIDSRHEGAFGITLYSVSIFLEFILNQTSCSISARLGLRALVETYITFEYLLKKEKEEPGVWDDYRSYGTGQIKLIFLKLQELKKTASSIEFDEMDLITNEDKWLEFVPIYLGHWDSTNLRKMAEEVKLKDIYDNFYNYTSGFMHGNWGAVRESVYQRCINPLHRDHRIPIYDLPLMPSVTQDTLEITNKILKCLAIAYPPFEGKISKIKRLKNQKEKPHE